MISGVNITGHLLFAGCKYRNDGIHNIIYSDTYTNIEYLSQVNCTHYIDSNYSATINSMKSFTSGSVATYWDADLMITAQDIDQLCKNNTLRLKRGMFRNGSVSATDGRINFEYLYRIGSTKPISFGYDVTITIASGFRLYYITYNNGTYSAVGWKTGSFSVSANQAFICQIARSTDDTSEIANVDEFLSKVTVSMAS